MNEMINNYKNLLHYFDRKNYYKLTEKLNLDNLKFIDDYHIIDFFIRLIGSFRIELDLSNTMDILNKEIEEWNTRFPSKVVSKKDLIENHFLICEENFVISNPYICSNNTDYVTAADKDCVDFAKLFSKKTFYYPLFQEIKLVNILVEHNRQYNINLTKELLLDEQVDFTTAIFHNKNNLKNAFLEALKIRISNIRYVDWNDNIEFYFIMLMEIDASEIDIDIIIESMEDNKKEILIEKAYSLIKTNQFKSIGDYRDLNIFKYGTYKTKGKNIKNDVSKADKPNYPDVNEFDKVNKICDSFNDFYFSHQLIRINKTISFIFKYFGDLIDAVQWDDIIKHNNTHIYLWYFSNYILSKNEKLLEYRSLQIAPFVIKKIFDLENPNVFEKETHFNIDLFKQDLLKYYIGTINEFSDGHFKLILDLYLYLSGLQTMDKKNQNFVRNIKSTVISEMMVYLNSTLYKKQLIDIFRSYKINDNFYYFDFFIDCKENNNGLKTEIAEIIFNKYIELLKTDALFKHYFDFNGINNLLKAFHVLKDNRNLKENLFMNFSEYFISQEQEDEKNWMEYLSKSRYLRLHLGILCLFLDDYEWDEEIADYILSTFRDIRKTVNEHNPLTWSAIVQDTLRLFNYNALKNEDMLTYHIFKVLLKKDKKYIETYLSNLDDVLDFYESILLNNMHKDYNIKESIKNYDDVSFGEGIKNATFLLNIGYSNEALSLLSYIEETFKKICKNDKQDLLNSLKYYSFITDKKYDEALKAVNNIKNDSIRIQKIATIEYAKENYSLAKDLFDKYFYTFKPEIEAIVNYSSVLLMLEMFDEAIEWCQSYIDDYGENYLLIYNLAYAFKGKNENVKSLYYFNEAKNRNIDYNPAIYGAVDSINAIVSNLPEVINAIEEVEKKVGYAKDCTEIAQNMIIKVNSLNIPDDEIRIVKDINKTIDLLTEHPRNLETKNENELSDQIKNCLTMSLQNYGYEVTRETPQGYSKVVSGELDLFIFKSGEYCNVATGENKIWCKDKFRKQMGQLFGYLKENKGFGFTIIFNKTARLEDVISGRNEILDKIYFADEVDTSRKIFEKIGPIYDMANIISGLEGVLLTIHQNPEREDSAVRIYHYIVNVSQNERKSVARDIRA